MLGDEEHEATDAGTSCSDFIRRHRDQILACWESRVRALPPARNLDRRELIDHLPGLLTEIADRADDLRTGARREREADSERFVLERLEKGFDLTALVMEFGLLRSCITLQMESAPQTLDVSEIRVLDEVIDRTVTSIIRRYTKARERTLQIYDRMASVALESRSLTELVQRLLQMLVQTSDAIQNATILVRETDVLRVRACIGLPGTAEFHLRVGEGFAGTIAATREPLELRHAASDSLVLRPGLRAAGVRALYGIPLIESGKVIAVAHIGSLTVDEFSIEDKRLFRAIASRATAAIFQHMLRETAERTAAELRERERELQQREQEFRALADNIPQLAWMADERGRAYWFNQRWLDYTGTTLEELCRSGAAPYHDSHHLARVTASHRQAIATGQSFVETFPLRGKNGRFRWFLSRAIPIRDERGVVVRWFGTNTDITDQRFLDEATKVLNSSLNYEDTLNQIAQLAVPDLADWCIVDLFDAIAGAKRVAAAHVDPARMEDAREWERRFPTDWDARSGVPEVIRTGQPMLFEEVTDEQLVAAAQSEEHLQALRDAELKSIIIAPLQARGRTFGAFTLVSTEAGRNYNRSDLALATELGRRAGIAIDNARLYQESQQAVRDREDAVRSRDEVLALVSHDLRNPLNAIGMSASMLAEHCTGPEAAKHVALVERSTDRMAHMIDDLLDLATIRARGLTLHRSLEDAEALVSAVIDAHQPKASSKSIELRREDDLSAVRISCDRDRLERVFANVIGNAIKYCRHGDVVSVRGHVIDDEARFSIADTGPGIPSDQLSHLFEPYWTEPREGAKPGTGLGLYIAKSIIEAHGGRMWVESEISKGTEFFFTLPLRSHGKSTHQHAAHAAMRWRSLRQR